MSNRVEYSSPVAPSSAPSGAIWGQMPLEDIILHGRGRYYSNDFLVETPASFSSNTPLNGMHTYQDSGVTMAPLATDENGVLQIAGADASNDEGSIQFGSTTVVYAKVASTGGKKLAFEVRVKNNGSALTDAAFFCGLAQEASAIADILVDSTGALKTTADFIGLRTLCASPSEIDAVYLKASGGVVEVDDNVGTLVLDTWVKLGYVFDPSDSAKAHRYYVDGVEVASAPLSVTDDATFPDGEEMALLIATKKGDSSTTVEKKFAIDWVRFAQVK